MAAIAADALQFSTDGSYILLADQPGTMPPRSPDHKEPTSVEQPSVSEPTAKEEIVQEPTEDLESEAWAQFHCDMKF